MTTSVHVIRREYLPLLPLTVVVGTSLTLMLAWWNMYLHLHVSVVDGYQVDLTHASQCKPIKFLMAVSLALVNRSSKVPLPPDVSIHSCKVQAGKSQL